MFVYGQCSAFLLVLLCIICQFCLHLSCKSWTGMTNSSWDPFWRHTLYQCLLFLFLESCLALWKKRNFWTPRCYLDAFWALLKILIVQRYTEYYTVFKFLHNFCLDTSQIIYYFRILLTKFNYNQIILICMYIRLF